jgi:thioredoxin reductase (NADPH)
VVVQLTGAEAPTLDDDQLRRLRAWGVQQDVAVGDILYRAGDREYDLILIDTGRVELVREATSDSPAEVVVEHGPGRFLGELNLLTRQTVFLTARVAEPGSIHRIAPDRFRRLMAEDPDLSAVLLRAFWARRQRLRESGAQRSLEIVGTDYSAACMALRTYAARLGLPHLWIDADSPAGIAIMADAAIDARELPTVFVPNATLKNCTPGMLAEQLGLTFQATDGERVDLAVIGSGPAGLAAAVYGASEGLETILLDAVGPGGQAAASSRIENYLGFPDGLSGQELTSSAAVQALKFGARIFSPCEVVRLDSKSELLSLTLVDGTAIHARAIVVATGAAYRALPLERWDEFVGVGIYYAATALEARSLAGKAVVVVGGANSAGQAALYLASQGCAVNIVVRADDVSKGMSNYLVERLQVDPRITIRTSAEVSQLGGEFVLTSVDIRDRSTGESVEVDCRGLFCFIGATPATEWLGDVHLDENGFVLTDVNLRPELLGEAWESLGRAPLPFETSIPAVFAAGDVRLGSMKRVAAAVGEGASAVASVHVAIGARQSR